MFKRIATITPTGEKEFIFGNGAKDVHCTDADDVGGWLEQQLWPLLEWSLRSRRKIKIIITDEADKE